MSSRDPGRGSRVGAALPLAPGSRTVALVAATVDATAACAGATGAAACGARALPPSAISKNARWAAARVASDAFAVGVGVTSVGSPGRMGFTAGARCG